MEFPNHILIPELRRLLDEGHATVTLPLRGRSMRPFLEDGRDKALLALPESLHGGCLQVGDAVLAEISPGHYVLHRIIVREDHQLTLKGDGNLQGVEHCTIDDVRGVVTKYIRPGGHVLMADDPKLKRKIKLWGKLPTFVRRVCLFIYRQTI